MIGPPLCYLGHFRRPKCKSKRDFLKVYKGAGNSLKVNGIFGHVGQPATVVYNQMAYRRLFLRGKSPVLPDGIHLHSLIFRRIVQWAIGKKETRALMRRNSLTSPYLWMFSLMAVIPATVFWKNTGVLIFFCLLFVVSYVWLYARIVRFKSPRWLILRKKNW